MKIAKLPRGVEKLLASCPKEGRHNWIYRAALKLHPYFPDKDELCRALKEATANCGREVPDREIEDAVRNSAPDPDGQPYAGPRWPLRNAGRIDSVVRDGPNLAQLEGSSPVRWNGDSVHTEEIIDVLYPGNPLLCAGIRQDSWLTRPREEWRGFLEKQQFIVPSPMSAVNGTTKNGKESMRTLANTGPRRFIVVEFDKGSFDLHAAVLCHLAKSAPLVMCVHSGNKSLHGWFYCAGQPEENVEKFFQYAVSLGADPATWTRCQLVRMPFGRRENGALQRVVFFNPKPIAN